MGDLRLQLNTGEHLGFETIGTSGTIGTVFAIKLNA